MAGPVKLAQRLKQGQIELLQDLAQTAEEEVHLACLLDTSLQNEIPRSQRKATENVVTKLFMTGESKGKDEWTPATKARCLEILKALQQVHGLHKLHDRLRDFEKMLKITWYPPGTSSEDEDEDLEELLRNAPTTPTVPAPPPSPTLTPSPPRQLQTPTPVSPHSSGCSETFVDPVLNIKTENNSPAKKMSPMEAENWMKEEKKPKKRKSDVLLPSKGVKTFKGYNFEENNHQDSKLPVVTIDISQTKRVTIG